MANQELQVGSRWKWTTPYGSPVPFTYVAQGRIRYDDDEPEHSWAVSPGRIADGAVPLPAHAVEEPLCTRCDEAEVAPGRRCPKCGFDAPAAEPPVAPPWECDMCKAGGVACPSYHAKPAAQECSCAADWGAGVCPAHSRSRAPLPALSPPRCTPGCTPAQPCRAMGPQGQGVCRVFHENWVDTNGMALNVGLDRSDIPPAREPRIGALSWSHATVCGGLSTRRGR